MTPEFLLVASLLLPLGTGIVCLALMRAGRVSTTIALLAGFLQIGVTVALLLQVDRLGYVVVQAGNWPAPFGISLVADRLSAAMVAISSFTGFLVLVSGLFNRERTLPFPLFLPLTFLLLLGVNGSFLTGDLFNLYVWFEVMLIASFVMLIIGGTKPQLDGGMKYVLLNLLSSALFLIGVGILYGKLGTLNMADIAQNLALADDPLLINITSTVLLVAFGVKAGIFPLFFWLPASYHTPAFVVSALFAGLLTKVGVYALMRSQLLLFAPYFSSMQTLLLILAAATMVTGVLGAAAQFHTRRILSFHIISQIGYMLMGLAMATQLAIAGAIFYIVHNIVAKTALFFVAALIHRKTGQEDLGKLGGLAKSSPWLALLFLVPALALAGIPPLSGFWAKFSLVQSAFAGGFSWLAVVALGVSILTLFSMMKIWNEAFWKPDPQGTDPRRSAKSRLSFAAASPAVVLAVGAVLLGVFADPVFGYFLRAADQLMDPVSYVQAVLHEGVGPGATPP
jgi:multicomponent Na+:H+ antiporter subunit D